MKKIKGRSEYISLETGFWGIVADNGEKYLPINMPEQLKTKGAEVECTVVDASDMDSMFQWGTLVRVVSFKTIMP